MATATPSQCGRPLLPANGRRVGGTPLGACIWGAVNFRKRTGDYPACAERLIATAAKLPERAGGTG